MTSGRTFSVLLKFSLPMLLSVAFQQLYNIVDSVIAGNFVSDMALGAIGASYPVTMIFMAVATGGSVGASVVVARLFGSKNYTYMKTAINTALVSFVAIAGVLTVIGCALCSPMLTLLGTPDDIFADSDIYLRVYVLGLVFLFIYNACNGIFTALGDSKTPLFFLIASSLGNIGLDLLFVIVFQMGVAGVAWATFAAQGAAGVAAFFVLLRRVGKIQSDTPKKPKIFSSDALKQISRYFRSVNITEQFCISRKSVRAEPGKQLRFIGNRRLCVCYQAEYFRNNLFLNAFKQRVELLRSEHRRRQDRPC